jgi:hypothetical protein
LRIEHANFSARDSPTARLLRRRGLRNGWGYGRSVYGLGHKPPADKDPASAGVPPTLADDCFCVDDSCAAPTCLATVLEADVVPNSKIVRTKAAGEALANATLDADRRSELSVY